MAESEADLQQAMSEFEKEFQETEQERAVSGGFYKFVPGNHVMRLMSEPVKKASRFNYGLCFPGAPYCDPAVMRKEYDEKMADYNAQVKAAKAAGKTERDIKEIKKPSAPNVSVKWSVWALVRRQEIDKKVMDVNTLMIADLPHSVMTKIMTMKADEDMGTAFKGWPMPYDVKVVVKKKDTKGRAWTAKDVEYDVIASTKHTPLTNEESEDLAKETPMRQILEKMQEKARVKFESEGGEVSNDGNDGGGIDYPTDNSNPDDIPF